MIGMGSANTRLIQRPYETGVGQAGFRPTRRANQKNLSIPPSKNIPLKPSGKSALQVRPSHPTRGACARHETRGGMRWTLMCH